LGASITTVQRTAPDYTIDPELLAQAVTSSTKLILLTNLHNPTGNWLTDDMLLELARLARAKNPKVTIVVDEVYHDFVYDRQKPAALLDDCFITLNSLTKAYGLGCLHCGWIAAPEHVIAKVREVLILVEGTYPRVQENINAEVVESLERYRQRTMQLLADNREVIQELMPPLVASGLFEGDVPVFGCIYFPRIRGISDTFDIVKHLAERFQVYVVPGKFFGEPRGIRIGFGGETESLRKALTRLVEGIQTLVK
jgi:aspartate/methionine/tyrosine aminotransferase